MTSPTSFPAGPLTPLQASRLTEGIDENLWFTNADETIQFYVKGPWAPVAPGIPGQDGIVVQSIDGLAPDFKHKDLQGADQDGVTWTDTVYDPAKITLQAEIHAATAQGLTEVWDAWVGVWNPRKTMTAEYITLDGGYWYAKVRLDSTWKGPIKYDRRFLWRPLVHKMRIDGAFWCGAPSVSNTWGPTFTTFGDTFEYSGNLSSSWTTNYSAGHTGTVQVEDGAAEWTDEGNSTQFATNIYNAAVTDTDFQIIGITLTGAWEGLTLGGSAYNDIWGRMSTDGTSGIRCRLGWGAIQISRFNSGVGTSLYWAPLLSPPRQGERWDLYCGASTDDRIFEVRRNGARMMRFLEFGAGSHVGSAYRSVGFGMVTAGSEIIGEAVPVPVSDFGAADNNLSATESGWLQLSNIGTEDGYPSYTAEGPGTWDIGDFGTGRTVSVGPLADGQTVQITTLPRLRSIVDVDTGANLYPLMSGRFTGCIPGVEIPSQAQPVQIPVSVTGGSGSSRITASLTPRRVHPA